MGPVMAVTIVIAILILVIAGIPAGAVITVSAGIRREDRRYNIAARQHPDRLSQDERRLTDLYGRSMTLPDATERETSTD